MARTKKGLNEEPVLQPQASSSSRESPSSTRRSNPRARAAVRDDRVSSSKFCSDCTTDSEETDGDASYFDVKHCTRWSVGACRSQRRDSMKHSQSVEKPPLIAPCSLPVVSSSEDSSVEDSSLDHGDPQSSGESQDGYFGGGMPRYLLRTSPRSKVDRSSSSRPGALEESMRSLRLDRTTSALSKSTGLSGKSDRKLAFMELPTGPRGLRSRLEDEEAALEEMIVDIVNSGQWSILRPNTRQSVSLGEHQVCVSFQEEPGSGYRAWEWHGHVMVYNEGEGYTPEYVYGNYFEPCYDDDECGGLLYDDDDDVNFALGLGAGLGGVISGVERHAGPLLDLKSSSR